MKISFLSISIFLILLLSIKSNCYSRIDSQYHITLNDTIQVVRLNFNQPPELKITAPEYSFDILAGDSLTLGSDIVITGGKGDYTYVWKSGKWKQNVFTKTIKVSPTDTTEYLFQVNDYNGCSATEIFKVNVIPPIRLNYTKSDAGCYGSKNGSIILSVDKGVPPYSYSWSSGQTTATINGLAKGIYHVTVSDSRGQTISKDIEIKSLDQYRVTITKSICEGESYSLGNKTYNKPGQYVDTLTSVSGCDSIVTLTLNVNPKYNITENKSICYGQSYYGWTNSGTYKRTLKSGSGCDSTVTTVLTVDPVLNISETKFICAGQSYNGWTTSGTYKRTLQSKTGCDSIVITFLTVNPVYNIAENKLICSGQSYNGWTTTGNYKRTLQSKMGCDSIVTTFLTVSPIINFTENISICAGQNYQGWTASGTYQRNLKSKSGCDSVVTTNLTVNPVYNITENKTICSGQNYNGWTTSGPYKRTLLSHSGCDSVVTTFLTVNPTYNISENKVICQGKNYLGWTSSGSYKRTLQTKTGCDSIVTTILTVYPVFSITENKTICQGQNYNGWTMTGKYSRTLKSRSGCDSIITTNLTVNPVYNITENKTICQGQSYQGWSSSGTYKRTLQSTSGCDSTVSTGLTVFPSYNPIIIANGDTLHTIRQYKNYQWYNELGIITGSTSEKYVIRKSGKYHMVITDENGCINSSEVFNAVFSDIITSKYEGFRYSIIPNPNTGQFTFRIDSNPEKEVTLKLVNTLGQVIEIMDVKSAGVNHKEQFDVSYLSKGMYFLIISSERFQSGEKIVIQ